jgi:hypothetical protein
MIGLAQRMKYALALAALLIVTPALARERCDTPEPGLHVTFGFGIGGDYDEQEQEIFDKMELRKRGVNARTAKRTSDGCIEAWVPDGSGGFDTQYFDEDTFELKLD